MGCGRFLRVAITLFLATGVGPAFSEELNIKREKVELNFNAMIDDVNKEGAAIAESIQGDIVVKPAVEPASTATEEARVKEFLDVEMGLGDASGAVGARGKIKATPSTPIPSRGQSYFEDEDREKSKGEPRGPSSLAQKGMGAKKLAPN